MQKILEGDFFNRPALQVAPDLLGKFLVRKIDDQEIALMINEAEAYDGPNDRASHGRFGKTPRTAPMFGPAGCFYVYFIYGMYWMLNIVVDKKDYPAAILIRGAGEFNGPGKLTKALAIDKSFNSKVAKKETDLWLEDRLTYLAPNQIIRSPRIGVSYAGEWAEKPYRFLLK